MTRGDIWWVQLRGRAGFRPAAIVSRRDAVGARQKITIAEVTRVIRRLPSEIPLGFSDGMPAECVINTDNLHTIPKGRFRGFIAGLSPEKLFALDNALRYSLELEW